MISIWQFWLVLSLFTAAGLGALAAYIWRSRATEGGGSFLVLILAVAYWVLCSGLGHPSWDVEPTRGEARTRNASFGSRDPERYAQWVFGYLDKDKDGKLRGSWSVLPDGTTALLIYDEHGKVLFSAP